MQAPDPYPDYKQPVSKLNHQSSYSLQEDWFQQSSYKFRRMDWHHVSGQYVRDEVMAFEDARQLPIVDI